MRGGSYNRVERFLHWLALQPRMVRELSFDLECASSLGDASASDRPVYVTGLARSGTTMLLRALARLDCFRSLTYRDMPFVLAPNLWRRVTTLADRKSAPSERAHGDGIMVDFDSPEAFEEVYWRTFVGEQTGPTFGQARPTQEALDGFARYRAVIANPKGSTQRRRYLSKNNNNIVRLEELGRDPTAIFIVPYRGPVACARSLHRQHKHFCATQAADPFIRRYMGWLGHHEFGLDHKPFDFAASGMDSRLRPEQPDYWLDYWIAVHEALAPRLGANMRLVGHERFCESAPVMMTRILAILGVEGDGAAICDEIRPAPREAPPDEFSPALVERAGRTFEALGRHPGNVQ